LNSLFRALSSSIGKKLLMGITGLSLCGFLVVHLAGNFLLYAGAESYNAYAHALHSQKILLPIAEIGLFALLFLHILLGIVTARENYAARKVDYNTKQSKIIDPSSKGLPALASSMMVPSGLIVLLFLIVHIGHFKLGVISPGEDASEHAKAVRILGESFTHVIYLLGTLVLGFHLFHGFQSAFQSLGFNHPKYTPLIKKFGFAFAVVIGLGFASFPLLGALGFLHSDTQPPTAEAEASPEHSHPDKTHE